MIAILLLIYTVIVGLWLLFSLMVVFFSLRHHFFSITTWVMVVLYVIISINIFSITFSSLGKYTSPRTIFPFFHSSKSVQPYY